MFGQIAPGLVRISAHRLQLPPQVSDRRAGARAAASTARQKTRAIARQDREPPQDPTTRLRDWRRGCSKTLAASARKYRERAWQSSSRQQSESGGGFVLHRARAKSKTAARNAARERPRRSGPKRRSGAGGKK